MNDIGRVLVVKGSSMSMLQKGQKGVLGSIHRTREGVYYRIWMYAPGGEGMLYTTPMVFSVQEFLHDFEMIEEIDASFRPMENEIDGVYEPE